MFNPDNCCVKLFDVAATYEHHGQRRVEAVGVRWVLFAVVLVVMHRGRTRCHLEHDGAVEDVGRDEDEKDVVAEGQREQDGGHLRRESEREKWVRDKDTTAAEAMCYGQKARGESAP